MGASRSWLVALVAVVDFDCRRERDVPGDENEDGLDERARAGGCGKVLVDSSNDCVQDDFGFECGGRLDAWGGCSSISAASAR